MGQPIEGSNPSLSATALAGPSMPATRAPRHALVGVDSSTARDVITGRRSILDSAFPSRTVAVPQWS